MDRESLQGGTRTTLLAKSQVFWRTHFLRNADWPRLEPILLRCGFVGQQANCEACTEARVYEFMQHWGWGFGEGLNHATAGSIIRAEAQGVR